MVVSPVPHPCPRCGRAAESSAAFCSACGARLGTAELALDTAPPAAGPGVPDTAPYPPEPHSARGGGVTASPAVGSYAPVQAMDALAHRLAAALGPSYEVGTLLGRGGFAEVYAVRDLRLKRDLAVKVLRPDLVLTEALLERFRREAETVAALRHPNIIPIFDIGERDGLVYLVMPLIRGETLRARLQREERIEPAAARRLLHEAATALAAAHEAGIVHRDVKPDNIMLEGRAARVLLMDFGIAKALDAGPELGAGLTQTGMALGTPHYMSPEQAFGERTIDGRSDQYSLAVVGYAMLTGQLPFPGDSVGMILKQQISDQATPLRTLVPDVPDDLADALDRAMRKDPDARFANAEEFAAALAVTAGEGDALRLPPVPARIPLAARPVVRVAAAVVGVLALVVFGMQWPRSGTAALVPFGVSREAGRDRARTFLERQGGPRYQQEHQAYAVNDSALEVLRWATNRAGATAYIARHGGYRAWALRWVQPPSREQWQASVGEGGRVVAFTRVFPDTTRPPEAADTTARAAAERFLADAGYPAAGRTSLALEAGVDRAGGVTTRQFAWVERGTTVRPPPGAAPGDSAAMQLDVTVAGDRVTRFRRGLTVPEGFRRAARTRDGSVARTIVPLGLFVGALGALVRAYMVLARRARLTVLPWRPALFASLALGLLMGVGMGVNLAPVWAMEQAPDGNWTTSFIQQRVVGQTLAGGLLLGLILVPVLAAVIPFVRTVRPEAALGAEALLRGRPRRGAMLDACVLGYPLAAVLLLTTIPYLRWDTPSSARYPQGYNEWIPALAVTTTLYVNVVLVALMAMGIVGALRWLRRPEIVVAALALVAALLGGVRDGPLGGLLLGTLVAVYLGATWWLGLVPTLVGLEVAAALELAVNYFPLGQAGFLAAGLVAVAGALLPLAVALVAPREDGFAATGGGAAGSARAGA